jgi:predicted lysophospholipase L1 biosynthesis ABC-type transport system permease subunit
MEKAKQWKIIYIQFASTLVVIFASTALAMKYDDYIAYIVWGGTIYAVLLIVVSFLIMRKDNAT